MKNKKKDLINNFYRNLKIDFKNRFLKFKGNI
jgi:hypothetical protein